MKRLIAASAVVLLSACGGSSTEPPLQVAASDAGADADAAPLAPQTLAVSEVSIYQSVKIPVMKDGAPVGARNAGIVAGREALIRASVKPAVGWKRKSVRGLLELTTKGVVKQIKGVASIGPSGSSDDDADTTLNFDVAKGDLGVDTTWSVKIDFDGGDAVRYPEEGADALGATVTGVLKVKLVPVKYMADGSGRLPDVSAGVLDSYKSTIYAMYPVTDVEISLRDPIEWSDPIEGSGSGWEGLLSEITAKRAEDAAPSDVYYYGLFVPNASFYKYCFGASGGGCVAGLSNLGNSPADATMRASIGLGYAGDESATTMAHEIGHAHGRPHSPCGNVAGVDRKFPYTDGSIGTYAWDLRDDRVLGPSYSDLMGYCAPIWVADYTYQKLFDRVTYVNKAASVVGAPARYRMIRVAGDGSLTWGKSVTLTTPPMADPRTVEYVTTTGEKTTVTGNFYGYDHLPGGVLFVAEPKGTVARMTVVGAPGAVDRVLQH